MARRTPVLPGLSRSSTCQRRALPGGCGRLTGHKGACRPTLHAATKSPVVVGPKVVLDRLVTAEGRTWNVVVFDDGTVTSTEVVESPAPVVVPAKAAKRTATKSLDGGVEVLSFDRYTVQPEPKARRARPAKRRVRNLPDATAEGRDVQTVKGKSSRRRGYIASAKPSSRLA